MNSRFLEGISTKYLIITILGIILGTVGGFILILSNHIVDVTTLSAFIDAVVKTIAVLVGAVWALNRYYVGRTDAVQIKVDSEVGVVRDKSFVSNSCELALLVYRLDLINTAKSLIPDFYQKLEIEAVTPTDKGVEYQLLYRWPSSGMHPGGQIEPNSWSAINDAIAIESNIKAVRFYLEIQISKNNLWTWHKTFDISDKSGSE